MADEKNRKPRSAKKSKREDIVLTKDNLLLQPLALAVNGYEATAFQQNVVIAVLRKLRGAILDQRNAQFSGPVQLSLFDNEGVKRNYLKDGDLAFDIHLKELGVDTPHYHQAWSAVQTIADAKVWVPAVKEDGTEVMIRKSFFEIGLENMDVTYDKNGKQNIKYKSRSPEFTVIMQKEVVDVLFPRDGRIYDFIDNTALMISEKFPKRIYLYLSNYKYMDGGLTVDYWKFRHDIGFNDNLQDGRPKPGEKIQYSYFCDFEKRVLRPSVETLKEMSGKDISDFWFDYTPIYKGSKRAKHPDLLHFDFHLSDVGHRIKQEKSSSRDNIEMERRLIEEFDQTQLQVRRIITSLHPDERAAFVRKMDELKAYINENRGQIRDKRSYCNRTFTEFVNQRIEQRRREAEGDAHRNARPYPTGEEDTCTATLREPETPTVTRMFTDADRNRFESVKAELADKPGVDDWLPYIWLHKVEEGSVTISVPTRAFYQAFEAFLSTFKTKMLTDRIEQSFEREVRVCFREL